MDIHEYIMKMKNIQKRLLSFLTEDNEIEENFQNLIKLFDDFNITKDENQFRSFLHLIENISNNHNRTKNFISKIEHILTYLSSYFQQYLTNSELFNLFKDDKRILYFLFTNNYLTVDYYIVNNILKNKKKKYPNFFINEIRPLLMDKVIKEIEDENKSLNIDLDPAIFDQNRKTGENERKICDLIRNDMIDEFISYVLQNEISLQTQIIPSIFETNYLLTYKTPTLIEYAAFHGSVQIFRYLFLNGGAPRPFIWLYSIHGDNPEILHFLEEKQVEFEDKTKVIYLVESVRCHHNDIANYLLENYFGNHEEDAVNLKGIIYYNFLYFPTNLFSRNAFFLLCQHDHYFLVKEILKNKSFVIDYSIKDNTPGFENITTPFHAAIANDNYSVANALIQKDEINLNLKITKCKWTKFEETQNALFLAIINDNFKIVKVLLNNKNIDLNMLLNQKVYKSDSLFQIICFCPLIEAISNRNIPMIKLLINHPKIDLNVQKKVYSISKMNMNDAKNFKQISPLNLAIFIYDLEIVKILLSNPSIDVNLISINCIPGKEYKETPLYFSTRIGANEITKVLAVHPNTRINEKSYIKFEEKEKKEPALHCAIREKNAEIALFLLSVPGIDLNIKSWAKLNKQNLEETESTPLVIAIVKQQVEIVEALLNNPDVDVNSPFVLDSNNCHEEKSPLHLAVEKEDETIIKLLLKNTKINVNYLSVSTTKNYSKITKTSVLNVAISKGNISIVSLLVNANNIDLNLKSYTKTSEPNLIEEEEITPLIHAISIGKVDIIKFLIEKQGVDLLLNSKRSIFGPKNFFIEEKNPIQKAISLKNVDIVKFLLDHLNYHNYITVNFNELINMTDNEQIKAIIFNSMNKMSLR